MTSGASWTRGRLETPIARRPRAASERITRSGWSVGGFQRDLARRGSAEWETSAADSRRAAEVRRAQADTTASAGLLGRFPSVGAVYHARHAGCDDARLLQP